jgi:hypothetical protein
VLRAVLGVALAVALVAAATPALEDARTERTERLAERELSRVGTAAETLAREEAPGARRTLTLSFPDRSPTAARLDYVALGGLPSGASAVEKSSVTDTDERDVLAVRVAGGRRRICRVGVDLRVVRDGTRSTADSRPLVRRDGGTHAVTLRLVRLDGHRVVVVSVR